MASDQSNIPGLFSLHEAVEILTNVKNNLSDEYCSQDDINNFYKILDHVQTFNFTQHQSNSKYKPLTIVVEVIVYALRMHLML